MNTLYGYLYSLLTISSTIYSLKLYLLLKIRKANVIDQMFTFNMLQGKSKCNLVKLKVKLKVGLPPLLVADVIFAFIIFTKCTGDFFAATTERK